MERYHSPRIAEANELDGLSLPGEVQLALDDLAGSVRADSTRPSFMTIFSVAGSSSTAWKESTPAGAPESGST